MSKKWRREVKQQLDNEKLFKQSKEKKLDFSMNESPMTSNKGFKATQGSKQTELRGSVDRIRQELIQDDSEDEQYRESEKYMNSYASKAFDSKQSHDPHRFSEESNPLQKIIEQRRMESSSDSEESEEELDDDYDIGIDDIDLGTEDDDDIHTATEDEESNILINSWESKDFNHANYHKKRLKETLDKPRDVSPFTDVIEKGLQSYYNHGRREKLNKTVQRESPKKQSKVYDYNADKSSNKGTRASSQLQKRAVSKQGMRDAKKPIETNIHLSDSFEVSPTTIIKAKKEKKKEWQLEEVRRDQADLDLPI